VINRFRFESWDHWKLETVKFDALNLLVGPSGVGKSRILRALLTVQGVALKGLRGLSSASWELELIHQGHVMRWHAMVRVYGSDEHQPAESIPEIPEAEGEKSSSGFFIMESLVIDEQKIFERDPQKVTFKGSRVIPRLDQSQSCIGLFSSDPALLPFLEALRPWRLHRSDLVGSSDRFFTAQEADSALRRLNSNFEALRADVELHPFLKLLVLQHSHEEHFQELIQDFRDIFATVEEVKVGLVADFKAVQSLGEPYEGNMVGVGIRESGVPGWILQPNLAAGMAKTLELLVETRLSPPGGVLMIDELENSLGVNCLPQVAGLLLEGLDRRQIIATSHHFRVINEIPFASLKVVERVGTKVSVHDAAEIPEVKNAGSLDRFTELLNYLERQQEPK